MSVKEFEKLKEEKKEKVIRAAIDEFYVNGFEKASTNAIVKKAGIAKGSLFKYFKTKETLYYYMIDYVMNYFMTEVKVDLKKASKDVFERSKIMVKKSVLMCKQEPEAYVLLSRVFFGATHTAHKKVLKKWMPAYMKFVLDVFAGADMKNMRYSRIKTSEILLNVIGGAESYTIMEMGDKMDVNKFARLYEKRVNMMMDALKTGLIK